MKWSHIMSNNYSVNCFFGANGGTRTRPSDYKSDALPAVLCWRSHSNNNHSSMKRMISLLHGFVCDGQIKEHELFGDIMAEDTANSF